MLEIRTFSRADIPSALMADRTAIDGEKAAGLAVLNNTDVKAWLAERMFHPAPRNVLTGPCVFASTGLGMG